MHTERLEPLARAMRRAMAERGETFRSLAKVTVAIGANDGRGRAAGYLGQIARGEERPSLEVIGDICAALNLQRETIAEYQLAVTRRAFDERPHPFGVGLDQALRNLDASGIDFGALGLSELQADADPQELAAGSTEAPARNGDDPRSRRLGREGPAR